MKIFDYSTKRTIAFIIFAICVLSLRKRILYPDQCESSCNKISSEFDLIRCLDGCAVNSADNNGLFNTVPKERIFLYAFFVVSGFIFSAIMIDQLYINPNKSLINKIVYYYSMITKKDYSKIENNLIKKTNEELGYVQLENDE